MKSLRKLFGVGEPKKPTENDELVVKNRFEDRNYSGGLKFSNQRQYGALDSQLVDEKVPEGKQQGESKETYQQMKKRGFK